MNSGLFLIADGLPDTFGNCYFGALELNGDGDAVDVENDIRPLGVLAQHGHFFGHGESFLRMLPGQSVVCGARRRPA